MEQNATITIPRALAERLLRDLYAVKNYRLCEMDPTKDIQTLEAAVRRSHVRMLPQGRSFGYGSHHRNLRSHEVANVLLEWPDMPLLLSVSAGAGDDEEWPPYPHVPLQEVTECEMEMGGGEPYLVLGHCC